MLLSILNKTPLWVWALLLALTVLGIVQGRARTLTLRRALVLPVVMTGFSVLGTVSAFGASALVALAWLLGAGLTLAVLVRRSLPAGSRFDAATGQFFLPARPGLLGLIWGIFVLKYAVGVALALQPGLAAEVGFAAAISALYGAFSGLFAATAVRLWRWAQLPPAAPAPVATATPSLGARLAVLLLAPLGAVALALGVMLAFGGASAPPTLQAMAKVTAPSSLAPAPALQTLTARDGTALALRHYPAAASGPAHVAVLVHGSSGQSLAMHAVALHLQAQGISAYALDMRGHGASGQRGDVDYAGQLDDDIADLVHALRQRHPQARFSLVGHSSGGGFALRTAGGANRELFDDYVLLAPMLHQAAPTTRPQAGGWVRVGLLRLMALELLNGLGIHALDHLPVLYFALPASAQATHTTHYSHRLQQSFRPHADYLGDVRAITRPVRVLVGADDELFVASQYAPLLEPLQPLLKVQVLPATSHIGIVTDAQALDSLAGVLR